MKLLITVTILVTMTTACGKKEEVKPWPAHVVSMQGFTDTEAQQIKSAIDDLNAGAGEIVVGFSNDSADYTVQIKKTPTQNWPSGQAGFATATSSDCVVEFASDLFKSTKKDFLKSVVWHELGHCARLEHVPGKAEVMSTESSAFNKFSSSAINRFFSSFKASAGL